MTLLLESLPTSQLTLSLRQRRPRPGHFRLPLPYGRIGHLHICLILAHPRLERSRIDARDQLARLYLVVEVGVELGDLTGQLGADHDRVQRFEGARGDDDALHVPPGDRFQRIAEVVAVPAQTV